MHSKLADNQIKHVHLPIQTEDREASTRERHAPALLNGNARQNAALAGLVRVDNNGAVGPASGGGASEGAVAAVTQTVMLEPMVEAAQA